MKLAVTSPSFSQNSFLIEETLKHYPNAKFNSEKLPLCESKDIADFIGDAQFAIVGREIIDSEVLARTKNLKVISKYGVGIDNLDLKSLQQFGIRLAWSPGINKTSVAELTLGFMIALLRNFPPSGHDLRSHMWKRIVGSELSAQKVGIVGFGHIGKELYRLLSPFGCKVAAHDIYPDKTFNISYLSLEDLVRTSSIISIHLPLTDKTRNLFDKETLFKMSPGSFLINTARGGIVNERELLSLLKVKHIAGAAFDVFENEPQVPHDLLQLPNFLGTPHVGGSTQQSVLAMGKAALEGLKNPKEARKENFLMY